MTKHDLTSLREAAKSVNGLTIGQITTLCDLLASCDLIHVDEVPGYVAKVREDAPDFCGYFALPSVSEALETEDILKAAHEAFIAGCEQGSNEATSYEWGQAPERSRDEAWSDFMADWNPESEALRNLADHPDTDRETIRNALADAAQDAGVGA